MSSLGALPRPVLVGLSIVLFATLAACGGGEPAEQPSNASEDWIADVAPPPAERCRKPDNPDVAKVVVTASDGTELAGAEWGEGGHGVVLLPQLGGDLCGWFDYATELSGEGFHVLAIDFRGSGLSDTADVADLTSDAVAAVDWLKAAGATTVTLMGASMGATTAMVTVGRNPELVDAVVTLSLPPPIDVTGGSGAEPTTPEAAAPLIHVPVLMCWGRDDASAVDPQPIIDTVDTADAQVVTRETAAHGWDMLREGPADVRPEVLAFLRAHG